MVTREDHAAELVQVRAARPDIRVLVYEHSFSVNRALLRFSFKWTRQESGQPCSRARIQLYRVDAGKLAETRVSLMAPGFGLA